MITLVALALAVEPEVVPFRTPDPVPDIEAIVLLESSPGERYACHVTALVDAYGEVLDAAADECRPELRATAREAVRSWQFHPPQVEERAVEGTFEVEFVFVAGTVLTDLAIEEHQVLVRLPPTAVPRWPTPPRAGRQGRRLLADQGSDELRCVLDFQVDSRGMPTEVRAVDCPEVLERRVVGRLSRFGIDVVGAKPGDGYTYRIDIALH